jgi:chaperonin GroEL
LFPPSNGSKRNFQRPGVVYQPETYRGLKFGIATLVSAIKPTLGPFPRLVGVESAASRGNQPEILDSGGTIARRIIQIRGRNADVGAMFLRHMLWKLHERAGDGTATAAVIFEALFTSGVRYIAAGGNSMRLRTYLDEGLRLVLEELDRLTIPIDADSVAAKRRDRLTGLAESVGRDAELARYLGEIFDVIGAYGRLEVRAGSGRHFKREYVEGIYWDTGLHSRLMLDDYKAGRSTLENAAIAISNLDVDEPSDMAHILEVALQSSASHVLLVANRVSDRALSVALLPANREKIKLLAVKTPGSGLAHQQEALTDIAILTGGRPLQAVTQDTFRALTPRDLGRAQRISAEMDNFTVVAGKGDPSQFRLHIRGLQQAYRRADEIAVRNALQVRIGRLMGGSATLFTGGSTPAECENRKTLAEQVAKVIRNAILEGVVPGGGIALLAVQGRLEARRKLARQADERAAYGMLLEAMQAPFRALLANCGYDTGQIMTLMARSGPGVGIDLKTGKLTPMVAAGIVDPAYVLKEAVRSAVASAGLILTTDTIVHIKNPTEETQT